MTQISEHPDIFVVERHYDNGVGAVLAAFPTLDAAKAFSDRAISKLSFAEINITRCAPEAQETWRRFVDEQRWKTPYWENRKLGGAA